MVTTKKHFDELVNLREDGLIVLFPTQIADAAKIVMFEAAMRDGAFAKWHEGRYLFMFGDANMTQGLINKVRSVLED